jgi:hypothetical protein
MPKKRGAEAAPSKPMSISRIIEEIRPVFADFPKSFTRALHAASKRREYWDKMRDVLYEAVDGPVCWSPLWDIDLHAKSAREEDDGYIGDCSFNALFVLTKSCEEGLDFDRELATSAGGACAFSARGSARWSPCSRSIPTTSDTMRRRDDTASAPAHRPEATNGMLWMMCAGRW